MHEKNNREISFVQLFFNDEKIYFVNEQKSNILIIGIFTKKTKNSMIKIFLLHFLISFLNFIKEISELIINNKSFNELNDLIKRKIYEKFLFLPLKEHFQKITKKTLQRKNSIQSNIMFL